MKLTLTRSTPAGTLSVEETLEGPSGIIGAVRHLEAALSTAEADIAARHGTAIHIVDRGPSTVDRETRPDPPVGPRSTDHGPRSTDHGPRERFVPCNPEPRTGEELWRWAFEVGCCKRVLALGRAYGLRHLSRNDVYRWDADSVSQVYHEIQVKPRKAVPEAASKPVPGKVGRPSSPPRGGG